MQPRYDQNELGQCKHEPFEAAEEIDPASSPPNQVETDDGGKNQQHRHHVEYNQNGALQTYTITINDETH